ncbi:hypothetical protein DFH09DRAFT_1481226 [Mycena vulgaris]|nr:hypothetical protein DFH09DRAFT_1481226 [Mycena vulgaris]
MLHNKATSKYVHARACIHGVSQLDGLALMPALRVVLLGLRIAPPFVSPTCPPCSRFQLHYVSTTPPPSVPISCPQEDGQQAPFTIVNAQPPPPPPPPPPPLALTITRRGSISIFARTLRATAAPPATRPHCSARSVLAGIRVSVCICVCRICVAVFCAAWRQRARVCERVVRLEREWLVRERGGVCLSLALCPRLEACCPPRTSPSHPSLSLPLVSILVTFTHSLPASIRSRRCHLTPDTNVSIPHPPTHAIATPHSHRPHATPFFAPAGSRAIWTRAAAVPHTDTATNNAARPANIPSACSTSSLLCEALLYWLWSNGMYAVCGFCRTAGGVLSVRLSFFR